MRIPNHWLDGILMKSAPLCTGAAGAALLALAMAAPAAAETLTYRVLAAGEDVGYLIVEEAGDRYQIDYDYKNNGRGPTISESLTVNDAGYPVNWQIEGSTTFGNQVDEWFRVEDGTARWQDATGTGSAPADPLAFYVDQNGGPYSAALLARALLADEDRSIEVYPGGTATLNERASMTFEGDNGPVETTTYEITGLSMSPINVTLDSENEFFATASPRFAIVREGYEEAAQERLRGYSEELSTNRFVDIQAETAHDYDGPVRIRNVRIFDPETLALTEPKDVVVFLDRIASIQGANSPVTKGETVIDGEGGTLVPGMYEMHGHISQDGALLNVAAGVTSVRDMGNENDVLAGLIERIEDGTIAGPRRRSAPARHEGRRARTCLLEGGRHDRGGLR